MVSLKAIAGNQFTTPQEVGGWHCSFAVRLQLNDLYGASAAADRDLVGIEFQDIAGFDCCGCRLFDDSH